METGGHTPYADKTGWLGRGMGAAELQGLAASLPMLLRGSNDLDNYFPTWMRLPNHDTMEKIQASYSPGSEMERTLYRIRHRPPAILTGSTPMPRRAATAPSIATAQLSLWQADW